jgi:hypothetical protein
MIIVSAISALCLLLNPLVADAAGGGREVAFPLWTIAFFSLLILSIAVLPLVSGEW